MPFDANKKAQLVTRVGNAKDQLSNVEQTLLSGARDSTVNDGERQKCYELLRNIILTIRQLDDVVASV